MSDHEWCRDVQRDEAIRAAEDAAAVPSIQHRDLPEQVALLWASLGDIIGRVVRLEGEMDAGQDEEAAPDEGMRKEHGESARVVEETKRGRLPDMVARLIAERDAAKEECERLRAERDDALLVLPACCGRLSDAAATVIQERDHARSRVAELLKDCETYGRAVLALQGQCDLANDRVAELEAAAAPAANAGGDQQEPVAWGVRRSDGTWWRDCRATRGEMLSVVTGGGDANNVVSPLYAGPSRGWLTAEERELIAGLTDDDVFTEEGQNIAKALLARSTPPMVKVPTWIHDDVRRCVIAAIRAAGGEVEG